MDVYITFLLLFAGGLIICYGEYCDNNKLRRCREDIRRTSDRRVDDLQASDCRKFRENFDCLLDQTALCASRESEREDYGNDLVNAHSILRRRCNREEGYDKNRCFEKDGILQCEDNLPRRKSNADRESCRKYQDFKNCVDRMVESQCSWGDKDYLRTHYMDVARDLPWKCTLDSSDRPHDDRRNRTNGFESTCCRNERCEDRGRARDCREELIRLMDGRSNIPTYGNRELCRKAMDAFNCMLWHSYNCETRHQKDITTLQNGKDYIQRKCDTTGDLRRSCFEEMPMKDCDRHLSEESSSPHDVTCREYESYLACMERQLLRCSPEDELLQGIHLVNKVGEKAWTCSKFEPPRHTSSYDPSFTYSTGGSTQDDFYCETQARSEHRRCMLERDRLDDEARRENNHREKHVKTCCVAYQFRECTRQVVRQICQRERSPVIDSLMGTQMKARIAECQDVDQATCSATRMLNNAMIIVLAFAILRSIFPQE